MIGRKKEIGELNRLYNSGRPELVAIYGRRRVGKTYLVDQAFRDRITFRHAGLSPLDHERKGLLDAQLEQFYYSLRLQGMKSGNKPKSWLEAFYLLETFLTEIDDGSRQLVFIDELPWLDTPRSGFITAFESFWNNWACHRSNVMVVVCGSADSWVLDKLINNHGGLYNRVTYEIKLNPFTLGECEEYLISQQVALSRYDITQANMILGGIPYYLGYFQIGLSLAQNVDNLFFAPGAKLRNECDRLFASVFNDPKTVGAIVSFLSTRNAGYTRGQIAQGLGMTDGGKLSECLNALVASDFVAKYVPFGESAVYTRYRLIDRFCKFYLRFLRSDYSDDEHFWQHNVTSQSVASWRGLAFEDVCLGHIEQIKAALGVAGVASTQSAWSVSDDGEDGVQVDLLITRNDNVVNMCEAKFYSDDFSVDKRYYRQLLRRQELLSKHVSPKMAIHSTLITTFGLKNNEYSGAFSKVVVLDDLFM